MFTVSFILISGYMAPFFSKCSILIAILKQCYPCDSSNLLFRADRLDSMHIWIQGMSIEIQRRFTPIENVKVTSRGIEFWETALFIRHFERITLPLR